MARGDVVSRPGRGGYGGGSSYSYDDEGRGGSKRVWEWFSENWERNTYRCEWLFSLDDDTCYRLITASTYRFGIEDIAQRYSANIDSRAKRLVEKKCSGDTWTKFHKHLVDGYDREKGKLEEQRRARHDDTNRRWEAERVAREAKRVNVLLDDIAETGKELEFAVGAIRSDFVDAFNLAERYYQPEGDWLDDAVEGWRSGYGFGEEYKRPSSIKLSITLSLDLSNSMYYNDVHVAAAEAYRELGLALLDIQEEYPNDLYLAFFTFSQDEYDKKGRKVDKLRDSRYAYHYDYEAQDYVARVQRSRSDYQTDADYEADQRYKHFTKYSPQNIRGWYGNGPFSGEDTWISPLFSEIEKWEKTDSDPGAARMDIVITDAVLPHPSDIREASVIQERRNGNLQTVLLNFMPESEWVNSTLPRRCVQYAVDRATISGMLRRILAEFIGAVM